MQDVLFDEGVYESFLATVVALHPRKIYGYLLGRAGRRIVEDFYVFRGDLRSSDPGRRMFEPVGRYYRDHADAGFLAPPEETARFDRMRRERGLVCVGMFHVHLRHPPFLAEIDRRLHADPRLCHLIVSLRNPSAPDVMAYAPDDSGDLQAATLHLLRDPDRVGSKPGATWSQLVGCRPGARVDHLVAEAVQDGTPVPSRLITAVAQRSDHAGEVVRAWIRARSHVASDVEIERVRVGGLWWGRMPVTVAQYGAVMRGVTVPQPAADLPVTGVDADDAMLFAHIVGGRVPTVAEFRDAFEDHRPELAEYAVFSDNAGDHSGRVAECRPDSHGRYDVQGLVWEWLSDGTGWAVSGGSRLAFEEMCAPDVVMPTARDYRAPDIGFRVCGDIDSEEGEEQ